MCHTVEVRELCPLKLHLEPAPLEAAAAEPSLSGLGHPAAVRERLGGTQQRQLGHTLGDTQ